MNDSTFDVIKQIYCKTAVPVAVADEQYNILWKNPSADACELFNSGNLQHICEGEMAEGTKTVLFNGSRHTLNFIKYTTDKSYYIIEYVEENSSPDISHIKSYFTFLCTRLRESASHISMATDDIDLFIKSGDANIASSLNRIDRNVMLLLKEALIPEALIYASDSFCNDEPVNLAHKVALAAADTEKVLGMQSDIWQNKVDNVCANIHPFLLEVTIAYITADVCGGELFPDRVEYVVERNPDNEERGNISVRSICLSERKNSPYKLEFMKQDDFFTDTAFKDLLARKYGIAFEKKCHPDGTECIMHLNVLPVNKGIVKTDNRVPLRAERFSPIAVALSEKHYGEHYKNIKMN